MIPLVSVIIPVYNMEQFIDECVESVIAQSFDNLEIILINDGSKDKSSIVCQQIVQKYKNVTLIEQDNQGVSVARNTGMTKARGDYICFLDADDLLPPKAIASMVDVALRSDADMTIGKIAPDEQIPISIFTGEQFLQKALEDNPIAYYACRILYKREFLRNMTFAPGIVCSEDSYFVFECALKKPTVATLNEQVYIYRTNIESATRSPFTIKKYDDICLLLSKKETMIQEEYPEFFSLFLHLKTKILMMLLRNLIFARGPAFRVKEKEVLAVFESCKMYFQEDLPYSNREFFDILARGKFQEYKLWCICKGQLIKNLVAWRNALRKFIKDVRSKDKRGAL